MVKSELIQLVAEETNISNRIAEIAVNTVINSMKETLDQGGGIEIRGFGSFKVREYRARNSNHPRTGVEIEIPAKKRPFFKAGKELKERINKKKR